ncbi:hypothetical protein AB0D45_00020 [Streptomyces sp. NPDC048352]
MPVRRRADRDLAVDEAEQHRLLDIAADYGGTGMEFTPRPIA